MKAEIIKKRVVTKAILMAFADGKINTQKDVDIIILKIRQNFNMSIEQAGQFFRNAINS